MRTGCRQWWILANECICVIFPMWLNVSQKQTSSCGGWEYSSASKLKQGDQTSLLFGRILPSSQLLSPSDMVQIIPSDSSLKDRVLSCFPWPSNRSCSVHQQLHTTFYPVHNILSLYNSTPSFQNISSRLYTNSSSKFYTLFIVLIKQNRQVLHNRKNARS